MSSSISWTDDDAVLLKYAPGDTITGESFTRSTTALQCDPAGVYNSVAINTKRDTHYIGVTRTLLLEDSRINSCIQSHNLTLTWTKTGTTSQSQTAVGLTGAANDATIITDTDAGVVSSFNQSWTVGNNNNQHSIAVWFRKDTDTTRFPAVGLGLTGGTGVSRGVHLNTQTGAITNFAAPVGTTNARVIDVGLWWVVEIVLTNNTTGNVTLTANIYPAAGSVFGTNNVVTGGSTTVGQVNTELNAGFSSSPIFTTTIAVTRGADYYSHPFTTAPQETTAYAKWIDQGTIVTPNAAVLAIASGALATPYLFCQSLAASAIRCFHHNGVTSVSSDAPLAAAIGDTCELRCSLFGDGSIQGGASKNSAAEGTGTQSAANALATAWSGSLAWINGTTSATALGFMALQAFKIVAGVRSLTEMRAIASTISFSNGRPVPLDRLANWTPMSKPVGPAETALGTGQRYTFRFRTDHTVSFEIRNIPNTLIWQALRLQDHLLRGGLVSLNTGDTVNAIYTQCCLAPDTVPQITLSDSRALEYTMSLQLLNVHGTPFRMAAVY